MKKIHRILAPVAFAVMVAVAAPAFAEEPSKPNFTYGVIDMNRVMKESKAAQGIFSELESKRTEYQKQVQKEGEDLQKTQGDILKQKATLKSDDFEAKRKEWEENANKKLEQAQERKKGLDTSLAAALNTWREKARAITEKLALERGYTAVFTQDAVVLANPSIDLTDQVVTQLNKDVSKISVKWQK